MFWKMILGALTRQKGKPLMIAFAVGLGVSLATAMLNVMFDVGDKVNQELKSYGANLVVSPRGMAALGDLYALDEGGEGAAEPARPEQFLSEADILKIKMIFWAHNIVDFAPYLDARVLAGGEPVTLTGVWFDKHLDLPSGETVDTGMTRMKSWWEVQGRFGRDDAPREVMVGAELAKRLKLAVGDAFAVNAPDGRELGSLKICGIFHSGGEEDGHIFAPLALAQEIAGQPGKVQRVEVSALTTPENELARRAAQNPKSLSPSEWETWYCTCYISSVAYQIEEAIPEARVKTVLQVAQSEGAILQKTQLLMLLLTLLSLICSALAISNLVTANVMERSAEVGLLKAVGANSAEVILLIMTEILIAAFAGAVGGYFLGLGFAQLIGRTVFGAFVAAKALVIPIVAVLVLLVTLIGSLPAMRMLLLLRPTEVLHGK